LIFLLFNIYIVLTVITLTDRQIILNETVHLPILGIEIPLIIFFIGAPVLTILLFMHLQLYLNRLRGITNIAWRDFPFEQRRLFRSWLIKIEPDPKGKLRISDKIQKFILYFTLWWMMPFIFMLSASWFVKKHDPVFSYVVGIMPIIGTLVIIIFWIFYEKADNERISGIKRISRLVIKSAGRIALCLITIIFEILLFFFVIPRVTNFKFFCIDLSYQMLVEEPEKYYPEIYCLNLQRLHLDGARFTCSFLRRVNLKEASLQKANMDSADLRWSNLEKVKFHNSSLYRIKLEHSNLKDTDFSNAALQEAKMQNSYCLRVIFENAVLNRANLSEAKLMGAKFINANLSSAIFANAELMSADFQGADLKGVDFTFADLRKADFRTAVNLSIEQLCMAKTLNEVMLDPELMEQVEKRCSHLLESPK
jgi:hypothetical protein